MPLSSFSRAQARLMGAYNYSRLSLGGAGEFSSHVANWGMDLCERGGGGRGVKKKGHTVPLRSVVPSPSAPARLTSAALHERLAPPRRGAIKEKPPPGRMQSASSSIRM